MTAFLPRESYTEAKRAIERHTLHGVIYYKDALAYAQELIERQDKEIAKLQRAVAELNRQRSAYGDILRYAKRTIEALPKGRLNQKQVEGLTCCVVKIHDLGLGADQE